MSESESVFGDLQHVVRTLLLAQDPMAATQELLDELVERVVLAEREGMESQVDQYRHQMNLILGIRLASESNRRLPSQQDFAEAREQVLALISQRQRQQEQPPSPPSPPAD